MQGTLSVAVFEGLRREARNDWCTGDTLPCRRQPFCNDYTSILAMTWAYVAFRHCAFSSFVC